VSIRACAADSAGGLVDVLGALKVHSARLFGQADTAFEAVAIFDRPFSTVARLRIAPRSAVPFYAFTKIYKDRPPRPYETARTTAEVVEQEFAATLRLHTALTGRPGLASPRPIARFPEHGAIVTGELTGTPLDLVLRRARGVSTPLLQSVATRIAAWLRAYQTSAAAGEPQCWRAGEGRAYLDDRLRYITPGFLPPAYRERALALFDRLAEQVARDEPLVPIHADLCPSNILILPGGGVAVLDFATAQQGTRFHDVAHLYMHLELCRTRLRQRIGISNVQEALLAGFDHAPAMRDPLFRLMLLQHVVCHVTQVADSGGWRPKAAVRALVRWRWNVLMRMPALGGAAFATEGRQQCLSDASIP
jgi:tRNA A-37 threonylcarbamoyl transferase component Bud32